MCGEVTHWDDIAAGLAHCRNKSSTSSPSVSPYHRILSTSPPLSLLLTVMSLRSAWPPRGQLIGRTWLSRQFYNFSTSCILYCNRLKVAWTLIGRWWAWCFSHTCVDKSSFLHKKWNLSSYTLLDNCIKFSFEELIDETNIPSPQDRTSWAL